MIRKIKDSKKISFIALFFLFFMYGSLTTYEVRYTKYDIRYANDDGRTTMDERRWTIDYGLVYAGQLLFDGVPVDITTTTNEDLVIAPGAGGNTQIGDGSGTNTNATSNDDIHLTGILETDGNAYFDSAVTLGNSSSDTITLMGYLESHIIPAADSTYNLGSSTLAWQYIYADIISGYNAALALNPASGYSLTGSVTKNASTGNEVAYDLAAIINKAAGSYTGLKLNVTQTSAPGAGNLLIDLQAGAASKFSVDPNGNLTAAGTITGTGLNVNATTADTFTINSDGTATTSELALGAAGTTGGKISTGAGNLIIDSTGGTVDINDGTIDLSTQTVAVTLNNAANALNFDSNTLAIDAVNNRVGIGTTSPDQKLHVEGQCVTGDTLLPVIRLKENGKWKMENGTRGQLYGESGIREFKNLSANNTLRQQDLSTNQLFSQERTLWADKPIPQGGSIYSFKYSREPGERNKAGKEEFSGYSKRFGLRNISPDRSQFPVELYRQGSEGRTTQGGLLDNSTDYSIDSLLSLNPFEENGYSPFSILHSPFSIEYIPIASVKPGDYVLSLNEETGAIEPHRIKGLLDMGVKPVFELITETGRKIETTGNHPYLVKLEVGSSKLEAERQEIAQKRIQEIARKHNLAQDNFSEESEFSEPRTVWLSTPADKQTKAGVGYGSSVIGYQNEKLLLEEDKEGSYNCPELTHYKSECPANNFSFGFGNFNTKFRTQFFDLKRQSGFSFFDPMFNVFICGFADNIGQGLSSAFPQFFPQDIRYRNYSHFNLLYRLKDTIHNLTCQIKNTSLAYASASPIDRSWLKVIYLTEGDEIAVAALPQNLELRTWNLENNQAPSSDVMWDKISSMRYVGYKQVYDIEVEGTHNFIAGHWIDAPAAQEELGDRSKEIEENFSLLPAPNPQLPAPNSQLLTSNSQLLTPNFFFGGIIAHNTYISSNVGIGTTSPEGLLEVQGGEGADATVYLDADDGDDNADTWIIKSQAADNDLTFTNHASEWLRLTDAGNLGIGTTNPGSYKLYVNGDTYLGGVTVTNGTLTFGGDLNMQDNNITNVGDISIDSISGDANAIAIGDGADTIALNPTTEVSFSDKNITNAGDISIDSISGDANAIAIGDGADTIALNPTTEVSFSDKNITNAGDISLDSLSSDAGTSINVHLGSDAGDDFTVETNKLVVKGDSGNLGIGTTSPEGLLEVQGGEGADATVYLDADDGDDNADTWIIKSQAADNDLTFTNHASEWLRLTDAGNLGIGTTNPGSYKLYVNGDTYLGGVTVTNGTLTFGGDLNMQDNNITNVGDISIDSISGDANAIAIGDGADTIALNPTTEVSFSDKNITNAGDISIDSISGDANAIAIGDGADTIALNPTTEVSFSDKNITNAGDISLDSLSSDAGTSINVHLGSDAGDDFTVETNKLVVKGDSGNVGIGTTGPTARLDVDGAAQTVTAATTRAIINNTNAITTNAGATAVYGLTIDEPNITVGDLTPTNAASLYISGAATEATNNYALWVDDGNVQMDGNLTVGGTITGTVTGGSAITGTTADTFMINSDGTATTSELALGAAGTTGGKISTGAGNLIIDSTGGTVDINDGTIDLSTQTVAVTLNNAANALNFDSNTLTIDALNNAVGIGTASPDTTNALTIQRNGATLRLQDPNNGGHNYMEWYSNGSAQARTAYFGYGFDGSTDFTLVTTRGGSSDIVLDPENGVGVDLTAPLGKLAVFGAVCPNYEDVNFPNLRGIFQHLGNSGGLVIAAQGANNSTAGSGDITFKNPETNSANASTDAALTTHMVIKYDGKIGIGTTSPEGLLEVQGGEGADATVYLDADDGDDNADTWIIKSQAADNDLTFTNHASEWLRLTDAGNLGIGTTNPGSYKLYVNGDTYLGGVTVTNGTLTFGGDLNMQDNNITNVGDISIDSISGDANAIAIGDGADTIALNPTTEVSFSDKNITNAGDISIDSISGDANAIAIGDGADTIALNPTTEVSFSDKNITNAGDISLDSLSSDAGTSINVDLGSDAGDDFTVETNKLVVKGDSGNVGIGTTSPDQKLHVEGQCVTGDTLLPVLRKLEARSLKLETSSLQPLTSDQIEYVRIINVHPGDYVLSLNEETGAIEPHRIKGLLDMGVKPVFELITETGRKIETTGNHPYLVKLEVGSSKLEAERQEIAQKRIQEIADKRSGIDRQKVKAERDISDGKVLWKLSSLNVNDESSFLNYGGGQYTSKLTQKPEMQKRRTISTFSIISFIFGLDKYAATQEYYTANIQSNSQENGKLFKEIACQADGKDCFSQISNYLCDKSPSYSFNNFLSHFDNVLNCLKNTTSKIVCQAGNSGTAYASIPNYVDDNCANWMKVIYLQEGDEIAVAALPQNLELRKQPSSDVMWDKISSMRYVGYKQVYDIEVEGTHNFVAGHFIKVESGKWKMENGNVRKIDDAGNHDPFSIIHYPLSSAKRQFGGIIAHNTYISSNVGIGTTSPEGLLEVQGGEGADATVYLDADDGDDNADTWIIKSQAADNDLTFTNHASEWLRLTDAGNLGIGTTNPGSYKLYVNGDTYLGGVTVTNGTLTFGGDLNMQDNNITNVGDISIDSISGDANAIAIGDGADTIALNPTTEVSFSDKNITNAGDISIDSISGDANAIAIGDGADTIALNPTTEVSFSDKNITNAGDISLDSLSSDAGTSINVHLGSDAGDDFTVETNKLVVKGDSGNLGIGTTSPEGLLEVQGGEGADATVYLDADDGDDNADTWIIKSQAADNDLTFTNHASEWLRLTDAGNLGIGTTNPGSYKLYVNGDTYLGGVTVTNGTLTFGGDLNMQDNNITNVGDISIDSISGDANAIAIGDGADTIALNPTTEVSFSDKNITNAGDISIDSISGDANAIAIGDGADTIALNPTTEVSFSDKNITNAGDISLDSLSSDAGTSINVHLGSDAGDDFTVETNKLVVKGDSGNLGIGTTAPAQKLHVEGQCVTGDTLLPILRKLEAQSSKLEARSLKLETSSLQPLTSDQIEYVRIINVHPGDYVLSLNEETGEIEPHRIKGLLDMGIKPVFKMTTADGRYIKTTGNHPYLVKMENAPSEQNLELRTWNLAKDQKPSSKLQAPSSTSDVEKLGFEIEGDVVSENSAIENARWIRVAGLSVGDEIATAKEEQFYSKMLMFGMTDKMVMNKHYQNSQTKYSEDTQHNNHSCSPLSIVKIKNKSIKNPNMDQNIIFCHNDNFAKNSPAKYPARTIFAKSPIKTAIELLDFGLNHFISVAETITKFIVCQAVIFVKTPAYADTTVSDILWDRIVSIEYVGEEQVYDIEVEGTHNFIAGHFVEKNLELRTWNLENDQAPSSKFQAPSSKLQFGGIIAHNTYISSNVGIGTTSPEGLLEVQGGEGADATVYLDADDGDDNADTWIIKSQAADNDLTFTNHASEWLRLTDAGNLGIGTTNPGSYKLYVNGDTYLGGVTVTNGTLTFGGDLNMQDNNITNVGDISIDSISGDANAIAIGDGADTIALNPTTEVSFSDKNITNAGDISLDSLSSDAGTSINVHLGSDAGDDFTVETNKLVVKGDSGNVGIGTTGPYEKLEVAGAISSSGALAANTAQGPVTSVYYSAGGYGGIQAVDWGVEYKNLALNEGGGNVGIGTTGPDTRLHVVSSATNLEAAVFSGGSTINSHANAGQIQIGRNVNFARLGYSASEGDFYIDNTYDNAESDIFFRARTAGTAVNTLTIKGSGNVGIGTTNPGTKLDIVVPSGTATITLGDATVSGGSLLNLRGNSVGKSWFVGGNYNVGGALEFTQSTTNGGVTPSGTPAVVIDNSGNVGIGTTGPSAKLEVRSSESGVITSIIQAATDQTADILQIKTPSSQLLTLNSSGNLGIGTTNPGSYKLYVNGDTYLGGVTVTNGTLTFGGDLNMQDNNITNVGDISIDSISGDANAIAIGDGADTIALNPTTEVSFSDKNITNAGDISLDSLSSDAGTSINVDLGSDAGDDFTVDASKLVVKGDTGNVGIGTTVPGNMLTVKSSTSWVTDTPVAWIHNAYNVANTDGLVVSTVANTVAERTFEVRSNNTTADNGNSLFLVRGDGNVGIGTTGPDQRLNVYKSDGSVAIKIHDGLDSGTRNGWLLQAGNQSHDDFSIIRNDSVTPVTDLLITSAGNVGIGTTGPYSKLNVVGGVIGVQGGTVTGSNGYTGTATQIGYDTSADVGFIQAGNYGTGWKNLVLQGQSGNVGIGTTSPEGLLEVQGGEGADATVYLDADDGDDNADTWIIKSQAADNDLTFTNHASEWLRLTDAGNLGIGTTNPGSYKLYVNGDTYLGGVTVTNGTLTFGGDLNMQDNNITNVGDISIDSISGDANAIAIGDGADTIALNPTTEVSFSDKNITNAGDISLDSLSSDAGTSINVDLGSDAGDDFTVDASKLVVKGDSGNVGIGTTAPTYGKLEIQQTGALAYSGLWLRDSSGVNAISMGHTGTYGSISTNYYAGGSYTNLALQQYGGNVGIGTTGPGSKLHLYSATDTGLTIDSSIYSPYIGFAKAGTNKWAIGVERDAGGGWGVSNNDLAFYDYTGTAGTRMVIKSTSGNIGIGTTNPTARLAVISDTGSQQIDVSPTTGTNRTYEYYHNTSGTLAVGLEDSVGGNLMTGSSAYSGILETVGAKALHLGTDQTARLTILPTSGNVGIGTTGPGAKLHVQSADKLQFRIDDTSNLATGIGGALTFGSNYINGQAAIPIAKIAAEKIDASSGNYAFNLGFYVSSGSGANPNAAPSMLIKSDGNVGIGTTGPNAPLHVVGRAIASNFVVGPYAVLNDTTGIANTLQFGNYGTASFIDQNSADAYVYKASAAISSMAAQTLIFQTRSDLDGGGFAFVSGNTPSAKVYIEGSTGNVGIGTTGQDTHLQIINSDTTTNILSLSNQGSETLAFDFGRIAATGALSIQGRQTGYNNILLAPTSGNVGIGTTGPTTKLHVYNSTGSVYARIQSGSTALDAASEYYDGTNSAHVGLMGQSGGGADNLVLYNSGVRMAVTTTGNVGIGTTAPGAKLSVQNTGATITGLLLGNNNGTTGDYQQIKFQHSQTDTSYGVALRAILRTGGVHGGNFAILTDNTSGTLTERMRIDDTGNVGIGTTAPSEKLQVRPDTDVNFLVRPGADFGYTGLLMNSVNDANDTTQMFSIYGSPVNLMGGNVGIGTTGPTHLIHLNGGAYCDGTGDWIAGSDLAYKKDIDYNFKYGLKEVQMLKPVYYVHKQDRIGQKQIGFIAQDVQKVVPELVSGDEGALGLSYGQLTAVLVKAVQEQQEQIEELKREIEELKRK